MEKNKLISIVIPCYNEEKNINRTFDELLSIFKNHPFDFEIIAVNDGSKDGTWQVIKDYSERYPEIKGVNMMTNFGQSAAYMSGFDMAEGEYIVTVSADLEIPLVNVNRVIEYLEQGYDFVNTHRVGRWGNEKAERATKSNLANKLISKISGVNMQDRGSGMKGFRRVLIDNLELYGEMHRFIPDYLTVYGARMIEFEVDFKDREYGVSAYSGHKRTLKVILDLMSLFFMLYFAKKPFKALPGRVFGFTGLLLAGMGSLFGVYLAVLKLSGQSIGNRPLLTLAVLLIIIGVQSMMMGMLGELMMRVYFEASGRKTYTVREVIR